MNILANNLRALRKGKKITQDELAERLNVTRQTISSWETGRSEPDVETMLLLAQALDTDVSHLLGEENRETLPKLRKKYLTPCAIFGLLSATVMVLNVTLLPYLEQIARQTYITYYAYCYALSIPQLGYLFGGLFISSCLCLLAPLRLPKRWRVICICTGIICFLPVFLTCLESAFEQFFPQVNKVFPNFLFTRLYWLYPTVRTLIQKILPVVSGVLLFLGFQK